MKKEKKVTIFIIVITIITVTITLIKTDLPNKIFKLSASINLNFNGAEFTREENKIIVNSKDNLKYQIIDADFDVVNSVRLMIRDKNYYVDGYKKYIDIYNEKIKNTEIEKSELNKYTDLIELFNKSIKEKENESINKIEKKIENINITDNWNNVDNNEIIIDDKEKDKLVFLEDSNKNKYIYYYINTIEIPEFNLCTLSEEYLIYSSLPEEEKRKIEVIPDLCEKVEYTAKKSSNNRKGPVVEDEVELRATSGYPEYYSLVENNLDTPVKNQRDLGYCVAFATTASVEDYLLKKYNKTYDFSERHSIYKMTTSFLDGTNVIGVKDEPSNSNFKIAGKYLGYSYGPIYEEEMPYVNNDNLVNLSAIDKVSKFDVEDIIIDTSNTSCSTNVIKEIKDYILNYGSVAVSLYMKTDDSKYYNENNKALYYTTTSTANLNNHAVAIVGWDDNYSKNNFGTIKPSNNGAFIVKNSWGTSFGNDGYFYVSYEDKFICDDIFVIQNADSDFSDNQYFYDYGANGNLANSIREQDVDYEAIKVNKNNNKEKLSKVKFYTYGPLVADIYVIQDGSKTLNINNATYIGSKTVSKGGIYTYTLPNPIELNYSSFYVIVKYTYSSESGNVFQYFLDTTTPRRGVSYKSYNGSSFFDTTLDGYTIMLAAYTDVVDPIYRVKYHGNGGLYKGSDTWLDPRKFKYNSVYEGLREGKPMIWTNDNFFVRSGYKFVGWKTKAGYDGWEAGYSASHTWRWSDGSYGIGDEVEHQVDLYAQWEQLNEVEIPKSSQYCNSNLVYTGDEQSLVKTAGDGFRWYNTYVVTDAGKYIVVAKLLDGYVWSDGTTDTIGVSCNIEKATPTITLSETEGEVLTGNTKTFNEKASVKGTFTVTSSNTSIATVTQASSSEINANTNNKVTVTGIKEGTATITVSFTPTDTNNYKTQESTYEIEVIDGSITCSGGKYLKGSSETCETCPANNYCPGGTYTKNGNNQGINACTSLGSNYTTSLAGSDEAKDCYIPASSLSKKYVATVKTNTLTDCEAGYYCPGTSNVAYGSTGGRSSCTAGNYCPAKSSSQIACSTLGTGYTSDAKADANTKCYINVAAGSYKNSLTGITTTGCGGGKYSTSHKGYYNVTDNACANISAGCYGTSATSSCPTKCAQGSYSSEGSSSCTACAGGKTNSGTGNTSACTTACSQTNVSAWNTPSWNTDNTVSNICSIKTCISPYVVSDNSCVTNDTEKPTPTISGGTTQKATNQTLTLKCSDNIGVAAYYFGTTNPTSASDITTTTDLSSLTSSSGLSKTGITNGTYYLACKDAKGNYEKTSITIRKYVVNNLLETIAGVKDTYTNGNYTSESTGTYYIKNGTSITLSSAYTVPTGAVSSNFKGYSTSYGSSTVSLNTGNPTVPTNDTTTYYMWFNRNTYTVTANSGANGSTKIETVTKSNNSATANAGETTTLTVKYGDKVKVTATPNTGYGFSTWSGGYVSGSTNPVTGDIISENKTIAATFASNTLTFNGATLTSGTYGSAYTSNAFTGASNGTGSYTYTIKSGAPTGATINSNARTITFPSTTPAGTYNVVVTATDTNTKQTKDATMKIVINNTSTDINELDVRNNKDVVFNKVTTLSELKTTLNNNNIILKDKNGNIKTNEKLGTNDKIIIGDKTYDVAVMGDVTGDGETQFNDVIKTYRFYRKKLVPNEVELIASDLVVDNNIKFNDVIKIYRMYRKK